ncbi:unnamed protein product [Pleuronectes platessa]|uniref:DUF5523 domain-containing protein n=1 Tax=Pleuronectes platessa TaxID=8262 RepID=A0A9N7VKZ8_PLEPL|nr:unnamed protein product [Pleuronectes platessa]
MGSQHCREQGCLHPRFLAGYTPDRTRHQGTRQLGRTTTVTLASSSDLREKLRKKGRALQDTLVKNRHEDDVQELQDSGEDMGETLKRRFKEQRRRRKTKLLEQSSAQESHDEVEEISSVKHHSENEESAEQAAEPVVGSRPPTGSKREMQHTTGSQHLDSSVKKYLEERLRAAMSKGQSLQQEDASPEPASRLQSFRDRDTITRFDREVEPEKSGRHNVPPDISNRVQSREATRQAEKGLPTAEEAYKFFTFNFEPDPEHETEKINRKRQKQNKTTQDRDEEEGHEAEDQQDGDIDEDNQDENEDTNNISEEVPLVRGEEEDLFLIEKSSQDFLEVRKAQYVGYQKRIQRESERELFFTPSSRPVPTSIKLSENMRPRYLEDEGLYVGKRPPMAQTNENIMENRILKMEEGKKWIGDDGRIMALPDPIKESSTRPPLYLMEEDLDPALQTVYRKAIKSKYANMYIAGTADPEGDYQLDVDVSGLIFSHHPLFSREHVLGARLAQLYDQYLTRQHNNLTGHLTDKLNGLRSALRNIFEIHDSQSLTQAMQQRISDYSLEVRNTRQLRDSEQEKDRTLLKNIIKVWKEIKALREFQKFNNTPYKLFLRKENVDQASDEKVYEDEISAEVVELEAESEEEYQRKLAEYKKQLAEWKLSRRKQKAKKKKRKKKKKGQLQDDTEEDEDQELSESEGPEEEDCPKPEPPERPDFDSIEQQVREKAFRIRRKPGESVLIPELHASGNITANLCPRYEHNHGKSLGFLQKI